MRSTCTVLRGDCMEDSRGDFVEIFTFTDSLVRGGLLEDTCKVWFPRFFMDGEDVIIDQAISEFIGNDCITGCAFIMMKSASMVSSTSSQINHRKISEVYIRCQTSFLCNTDGSIFLTSDMCCCEKME